MPELSEPDAFRAFVLSCFEAYEQPAGSGTLTFDAFTQLLAPLRDRCSPRSLGAICETLHTFGKKAKRSTNFGWKCEFGAVQNDVYLVDLYNSDK